MSEIIILPVLARYFKQTMFDDNCNCPIAKAANEYFNTKCAFENVDQLIFPAKLYKHKRYEHDDYIFDHALASAAGYDDTIIFNLELKEVV